ncbi:uracil-DNA glycosylase [Pontibacillus yanchengensis]|uniref:Uracil-DNA glycosylase n=1 Tax=Pontibacillus yanchengensis Y32 TaxID=1385514 RepID=A0A0A2T9U7_9BACI|nr:uracil-DNA glycosylase [Pontibacillus yanchengensis]KGP71188.1 uracil-DNA glycosylase [Pontibacillus yanchengensis Y32]
MTILTNDWESIVGEQFNETYYIQLREFLKKEYQNHKVYPHMNDIFNALHYTPFHRTRVVIIGQDPYHGHDQAHGFSFSVKPGVTIPPSLRNIYKELEDDIGFTSPNHGYLLHWAKEGVLLLNTVLTVRAKEANSHKGQGWEHFTNEVIRALNDREDPVVFILWGRHAQQKQSMLDDSKHLILTSPHPSPFSAHKGFFGSKPFSKTNQFLEEKGLPAIDWQLPMNPSDS